MSRIAVLATIVAAAFALPSSASAAIDQLALSPDVLLGPQGATATTFVSVQCTEGGSGFVSVDLAQNTGGKLARSSGGAPLTCTGTPQVVAVPESFTIFALRQGKASANATVNLYDPITYEQTSASTGWLDVRVHK